MFTYDDMLIKADNNNLVTKEKTLRAHKGLRHLKQKVLINIILVMDYDKDMPAFWGTDKEYLKFIDLRHSFNSLPNRIEL